jgi:sarcosine oxidase subunit beta
MKSYDVIIIGAGSIGLPIAMALGEARVKTLVLDKRPSPGQGENKHAIGGIRATHSDPPKILTCLRSLEIFSTWEETYGDDIHWLKGGYTFPVYRKKEADLLKSFLPQQKTFGLNIDFRDAESIKEVIPGINPQGLLGGTHSPDDGSASPLLCINAFYKRAKETHVDFKLNAEVCEILHSNDTVTGVKTSSDRFSAPVVVDASGADADILSRMIGQEIPVIPESHEGGISEPVEPFFTTMVVDLRPGPGSSNFYFYQNRLGHVIFCITPSPPVIGKDYRETSGFLPRVCARMTALMPRLRNLRVRRVWRGLYPMSPDGSPLVGWNPKLSGLLHVAGTCGQGFMLGPGLGEVVAGMITGSSTKTDRIIIDGFSLDRTFNGMEALK